VTRTSIRASPWDDIRSARTLRLGLTGALLLYTGLVLIWVFCVPLFGPADERAHVDYAWQVAHGHLPVAGSRFTAEFPELGQVGYVQHVSNHPPLWYAVVGPLLRVADAMGHPVLGLYAIRLLNAGLTAVTLLVIARVAALVAADARREVRIACVVAAAVFGAVNPALIAASGAIQNDALAILLAALVALVLAKAVRTGVDTRTVTWLAVLCSLGTLTRVTFITVTVVAVAATAALSLWPQLGVHRPQRRDLVRAAGRGLVIVGASMLSAGWFLVLNLERYGDLTGGSAVYYLETIQARELSPGAAYGPVVYLLHPYTWWTQLLQLVAPVPSISEGKMPYVLMAVAMIVVLVLTAGAVMRRRGADLLDRPARVTMLVLALMFAGSMLKLAVHVSNKGGANQRYLLDSLASWTVGGALLVVAVGTLAPRVVAFLGSLGAIGALCYAAGIVLRTDDITDGAIAGPLRASLADSIVPAAGLLLVCFVLLLLAGLLMAVSAQARTLSDAGPGSAPGGFG
jgi:hypothetical protein